MPSAPTRALSLSASFALLLAIACGGPPPEPEPPPLERVENAALGLAIAALSADFSVAENDGEILRLSAAGPAGEGMLTVAAGPVETAGINLVQEVWDRKAAFEEMPEGTFHGQQELVTPIGTAYTARGSFAEGAGRIEEIWTYAIHPGANRLLTLTFRYPEGEAQERMGQLIAVLGEIEALGGPEAEGS